MRIGIFGSGGLGGFMGAKLAANGADVVFIARGQHLQMMRRDGLHVTSVQGDFHLPSVTTTDDPAEAGPCDVVLVAVKGWQVSEVSAALRPMLATDSVVVPVLNGVEAPAQLAAALGQESVAGGIAKIIAYLDGPGRIKHMGVTPYIGMGELDNSVSTRLENFALALRNAGVDAEVVPDIHAAMWSKFLFVVGWGGIGAVTRATIGEICDTPETKALVAKAMEEIATLAAARGVTLPDDSAVNALDFLTTLPGEGTCSLQRDIVAGKPSELESWNGAVVRLAHEAGIAVPCNEFVYASLLPQDRKAN